MPATALPRSRGPISRSLFAHLRSGDGRLVSSFSDRLRGHDVLGDDDVQLALHCIYELSYRGLAGIHPGREHDDQVVALRRVIEHAMESQLRDEIGPLPTDAVELLTQLAAADSGPSLSRHLRDDPQLTSLRDFVVHRSAYQLKEADPHSWALPRLSGRAKAALVEIQYDEYGRGVPGRAHAELFATTMRALDLDDTYGHYLDVLPAVTLATGNLISLLGLQLRLTPALIGHLALFEMTSTGPMARYSQALEAVGLGPEGREFFDVHVVADAYHEVLAVTDLVGGLLEDSPRSGREICFGALALTHVESAFSAHLLESFSAGRSSLLLPSGQALALAS